MSTESPRILLETIEPHILLLTISRPKALNALDETTLNQLSETLDQIAANIDKSNEARVLLVTGAGEKAFVAGADIRAMQTMSAEQASTFAALGQAIFRKLEQLPIPTIALVNGFALGGGCELALACDFILASDNARLGQPEVGLGITAGFGGTQRLPRRVGPAMAMELLVSGRTIKAAEAKEIGLANHVYPQAELINEGIKLAQQISKQSPNAVRLTKQLVHQGQDRDLDTACQLERQAFGLCFANPEQQEGMGAFVENRAAEF